MATDPSVKTDVNNEQKTGEPVVVVPDVVGKVPYDRELPSTGGRFIRNSETGELTEVTVVEKKTDEKPSDEKPAAKSKKGE